MIIGEKIRKYREEKELTIRELAKRTGFAASTIHRYETDKTNISVERLQKVANALNIDMNELLECKIQSKNLTK